MPPTKQNHILLLKTKSSPHDGYDEFFSARNIKPTFIPVLSHAFHDQNLKKIRDLLESGGLYPGHSRRYGGMIFTSQRAVEAFANLLSKIDREYYHYLPTYSIRLATEDQCANKSFFFHAGSILDTSSKNLPLYTVGPATARSLASLRDTYLPHATIHGEASGTGEVLSGEILEHYNSLFPTSSSSKPDTTTKPPLLFLVGETRRDIIPKTLMGEHTPAEKRIGVEEVVVYETAVVDEFGGDFERVLSGLLQESNTDVASRRCDDGGMIWVVVFSPTGCDAMVRVLKQELERAGEGGRRRVFLATIGPTTRDHLTNKCGFRPDVCAEKPSPEGVGAGIEDFMKKLG